MVSRVRDEAVGLSACAPPVTLVRANARRAFVFVLPVLPVLGIALIDGASRRDQIVAWPVRSLGEYGATLILSGVFWGALVMAAGARRAWGARALLFTTAVIAMGGQIYFFGRYHAYLTPRAVLVGTSMLPSVGQQLWSDRVSFFGAVISPTAFAVALAMARRTAPMSPEGRRCALDFAVAALLAATFCVHLPARGQPSASPDVLYFSSLGQLMSARWRHDDTVERAHPGPRTPVPLPAIVASGEHRSVLFILTESVRASDACSVPAGDCTTTPFTNALLPDRFGFAQMRALDSTTAVSLAVLWSGQPPTASREILHTAPLVWEYAHAAGFDAAYWTSQNLFFANAGTWLEGLPLSRWVSATDLEADPSYELGADDATLVDVAVRDLRSMHSPFVGVVHLSNTHFPYVIDASDAPFQPQGQAFGAGDATKVHNRYRNAIHRQDALIARLVSAARTMPGGDRLVVVFVSDHGEQIRERGAIGHTWGVYDEEVRVPFWIAVPKGVLTRQEERELRNLAKAPLTQLDVLPTLLDLMGIWDAPALAPFRRTMPGESLLRGGTPGRDVVLTNCSHIFACAFRNWGAMRGTMKLVATQDHLRWECFDVAQDPGERHDLGIERCGDLRAIAEGDGRGTPF